MCGWCWPSWPRALFANIYPVRADSDTLTLSAMHLPIALWLVVGVAYVGGRWFTSGRRMDFVRFSGELFIYYVLIALGGGVLTAFTLMMFEAIGMNAEWFAQSWLVPCGGDGRRHRRILAGRGEAERHREHGAGADQAVHAAVHRRAAGIPGHHGVDAAAPSTCSGKC